LGRWLPVSQFTPSSITMWQVVHIPLAVQSAKAEAVAGAAEKR